MRTSENSVKWESKFRESPFHDVRKFANKGTNKGQGYAKPRSLFTHLDRRSGILRSRCSSFCYLCLCVAFVFLITVWCDNNVTFT
jgi:hypothetical protein